MEEKLLNATDMDSEKDTDSVDNGINLIPSVSDIDQTSNSWTSVDESKETDSTKSGAEQPSISTDEWEDILGSGALMKKVIKEGNSNNKPKRQMICTINYKCTLENGNLVEKVENFKIHLGDLEVVQALDITLAIMNIGEICMISVKPRLAYGEKGDPPLVPPKTNLNYEIELINAEYENEDLTIAERKKMGNEKKQRGNWWYGRGEYTFAIQCYRRAMDYLDEIEGGISKPEQDANLKKDETTDAELQHLLEDRLSVYNNLAAAQMKQGATDAALQSLQNVLRCQPNNVKALYRKSMILKDKNDIPEAIKCLQKAKSIEPENTSILKEIKSVNGLLQKQKNYEKELAKRMFSTSKEPNKLSKEKKTSPFFWVSLVGSIAVGIAGIAAWRLKFS